MKVTILDIARVAGVTDATVSNVLNSKGRTSEATRQRVMEAATELGYRRNELARAVVTGKSRIIGVLTHTRMSEGLLRTLAGALGEAADHGYSTKLMHLPHDTDESEVQRILQRCTTWRLDGALVVGLSDSQIELLRKEMAEGNRPVAFAGSLPPEESIGAYSDDESAWRLAVRHLVDSGHRRMAHLGAAPEARLAHSRRDSCLHVMREFGIPVSKNSSTLTSWSNARLIEEGVHRLLNVNRPPTALLCAGDSLAMVAMRVARRRGLDVPGDLSVIGFGDHRDAPFADPALTTIAQPHEEVARLAVRQLLARVEKGPQEASLPPLPYKLTSGFQLIVRESTAPVAGTISGSK
jgi:DNA-binding LacI/PurR family transcriptional regulator